MKFTVAYAPLILLRPLGYALVIGNLVQPAENEVLTNITTETSLVVRNPPGPQPNRLPVRGLNIFFTPNGLARILFHLDVTRTQFSELFQAGGSGREIAVNIGQHFITMVHDHFASVPGYQDGFLALNPPSTVKVIFDSVQGAHICGSIVLGIDCSWHMVHENFPRFVDFWIPLVNTAVTYFHGITGIPAVDATPVADMGSIGSDLILLATGYETKKVCDSAAKASLRSTGGSSTWDSERVSKLAHVAASLGTLLKHE